MGPTEHPLPRGWDGGKWARRFLRSPRRVLETPKPKVSPYPPSFCSSTSRQEHGVAPKERGPGAPPGCSASPQINLRARHHCWGPVGSPGHPPSLVATSLALPPFPHTPSLQQGSLYYKPQENPKRGAATPPGPPLSCFLPLKPTGVLPGASRKLPPWHAPRGKEGSSCQAAPAMTFMGGAGGGSWLRLLMMMIIFFFNSSSFK